MGRTGQRLSIANCIESGLSRAALPELLEALLCGGDSRNCLDPATGTNKYHCPPWPADQLALFASCTASPISRGGLERAGVVFSDVTGAGSPKSRAARLEDHLASVEQRLLAYFGVTGLADASLYPSGTDAMLGAALRLAAERPGEAITAILPSATETGTGVPLAAACRAFDGAQSGTAVADVTTEVVEIRLRDANGAPRPDDELIAAYAQAAASAKGRPVVYLTHGTKTGLIAPVTPPADAEVIVDACQARLTAAQVQAYIAQGWPVVVTGSKFFGGPAFSGAVLWPRGRGAPFPGINPDLDATGRLGMVLRWEAALETAEAFDGNQDAMADLLRTAGAAIANGLARLPVVVPIGGLTKRGPNWADHPSIFIFAVRDEAAPGQFLTAKALQPLYKSLASQGVLLGQPVGLANFGGLRIALGARDLIEAQTETNLTRLFAALAEAFPTKTAAHTLAAD